MSDASQDTADKEDLTEHRFYEPIMQAVAQGWCWPDTEKIEMDVILAMGIVRSLLPVVDRIVQGAVDSGKR